MKKSIVLTVIGALSQAIVAFAGPEVPSKAVVTPPPPPAPESFFRPNEFDIGVFGTYATATGSNPTGTHFGPDGFTTTVSGSTTFTGWGGGMDFSYYFPWKYAGVRFQGAGLAISTGTFTVTETFEGTRTASRTGSISGSGGVITADLMLRLPLDDFWPTVHLAPYAFVGFGDFFAGGGGTTIHTSSAELNDRFNSYSRSSLQGRPLGNVGGGFEYRFSPHWGIFGEAGYNFVDHIHGRTGSNNFVQTNFGFRFAF